MTDRPDTNENSTEKLQYSMIGRMDGFSKSVVLDFNRAPTDDEVVLLDGFLRATLGCAGLPTPVTRQTGGDK